MSLPSTQRGLRLPRIRLWALLLIPTALTAAHYALLETTRPPFQESFCANCARKQVRVERPALGFGPLLPATRVESTAASRHLASTYGLECLRHDWLGPFEHTKPSGG